MALDSHYIPAFSIEDVLLDKDTGAPLSGGQVYFYKDNNRTVLKHVYQITGTSGNYSYTQLPDPMILSAIGTFQDALGNPVVPYFLPYTENGTTVAGWGIEDLYFVDVFSSGNVPQFTREAVPYIPADNSSEIASAYVNEISNPQFAVVNFDTSAGAYTYHYGSSSSSVVTNIAPNWDLVVSSTTASTVILHQTYPTGTLNELTNPGTILEITSSGVTNLQLRQRIYGSPNLWGSGFISANFIAATFNGLSPAISLNYVQSNGATPGIVPIVNKTLNPDGNYHEFPGSAEIIGSSSADTFPNAYIDIYFQLPLNIHIGISSVMVTFTDQNEVNPIDYDQSTLYRQIDHLYHYAYPIVPVGTVIDFAGYSAPLHYLLCDGTNTYSRITYMKLFSALTLKSTVTLASATTYTDTNAPKLSIGTYVEGTGIPASTTITVISGTTITISNAATVSASETLTYFPWGAGSTSSNFSVPNLQGKVIAGVGGTSLNIDGITPNTLGEAVGLGTATLITANTPPHTHNVTTLDGASGFGFGFANGTLKVPATYTTDSGTGTSTPFSIVQPTVVLYKYIRYE